ncbi:ComEA family DNA-binding protein [Massilia agri]|uniref:Helix-hairpin-helix domain-containing protein n=1 Tax=Massilia agri TaxID=1886785 RepID=A0ABT2AT57_9BURK|nr:helix-hairpin-helix domain-containing protein [Massilia agri]MCS0599360.1 helix-hairpin-helix domain-containing protein [Massilia agri]
MIKKLVFAVAALVASTGFAFAQVDVNKADAAALDGVKGVGPSMSKMILEERAKGEFKDWGDFQDRIKGMKGKKAMKLSDAGLVVNGKPMEAGMAKPAKAEKAAAKKEAKDKPAEQKAAM